MKFFDKLKKNLNTAKDRDAESANAAALDLTVEDVEEKSVESDVPAAEETSSKESGKSEKIEYTPEQDDLIGDIFAEFLGDLKKEDEQNDQSEDSDIEASVEPDEEDIASETDDAKAEDIEAVISEMAEINADSQEDDIPAEQTVSCDESETGSNAEFIDSLFADAAVDESVDSANGSEIDSVIESLLAEAAVKDSVAVDALPDEDGESTEEVLLDDEDVLLMTALGYSGSSEAQFAKTVREDNTATPKYTDLSRAFAFDGHEYRSKENEATIKEAYSKESLIMLIRAVGTVFFAFLLLIFDLFGKSFGGFVDPVLYPTSHILMSFQILLLASVLSYKQLWDGLKGIVKVDPRPYSMASLTILLTVVYNLTLALIGQTGFALYNFPAAFALLLCIGYDYLVLEREIATFNRVSSWDGICTLERVDSATLALELGDKSIGASNTGRAFKLRRGIAPDNYFHRLNRRNPADKIYNYIIAPVLALSIVVFIVSLAADRGFVQALNIFITIIQIGIPSFMAISAILPFFAISRFGIGKDVAILSEVDVADYSSIDTIIFDEKDAFGSGSLNINRIALCDGGKACDIYSVIEDVSSAFDKVGGAFAASFGNTDGDCVSADVSIDSIAHRGITATVGTKKYTIGNGEYLEKCGISVSGYSDKEFTESVVGGIVLHVALEGVEILKLYVTYSVQPAFAEMAKQLSARGIKSVLRSKDPYIDEELVANIIGELEHPVSVVKIASDETADDEIQTVDGGILANNNDWAALLNVNDTGANFKKWSRLSSMIGLGFLFAGVLLSAILGALGASVGLSPLYVVLFQLIAILPSVVISKLLLD